MVKLDEMVKVSNKSYLDGRDSYYLVATRILREEMTLYAVLRFHNDEHLTTQVIRTSMDENVILTMLDEEMRKAGAFDKKAGYLNDDEEEIII